MTRNLDDCMGELAATPADRSLAGLEAAVDRAIAARRREAQTLQALGPARLGALGIALAIGVATGGATATAGIDAPGPAGAFATAAQLAPSTLLDGAG